MLHTTLADMLSGVAGLGCLAAAITHSLLGEHLFIRPIQAQMTWPGGARAADFFRQIVRLAWHATSVMWAGFAVLLTAPLLGFDGMTTVYTVAAATFAVVFVMTGPSTAWRHRGWPVFAVITASLIGAILTSV